MTELLEKKIWEALSDVQDTERGDNIVNLKMVSGLQLLPDGGAIFMIEVEPERGGSMEPLRQAAERAVKTIEGVGKVSAILTAQRKPQMANKPASNIPDPHGMEKSPKLDLPIEKIIAVASGKGGVGKSTLAFNLAYQLAKNGRKVGLLDADIYGPSVPKLTGLEGRKPKSDEDKNIIPFDVHGLKVMSIGFMVDASKALVWRGPMVQSALYQLFRDVKWGTKGDPLDILIVDMPPGTGDAQLTLAQKVNVDGAIIVSTPQDIALIDARKGIEMFRTVDVPILGVIENMSTHICSNCGHEDHIFGHGGAENEAKKMGVQFLGSLPLHIDVRKACDNGKPLMLPQLSEKIQDIVESLLDKI